MEKKTGDVVRRGRLRGERSGEMMHFLSSMNADRCIADADILVDMAHVLMLSKRDIIGRETAQVLLGALLRLYDQGYRIPSSMTGSRISMPGSSHTSSPPSAKRRGAGSTSGDRATTRWLPASG